MRKFLDLVLSLKAELLLSFIILFFILIRIPYLNLPFYWDEAWSYARAIFDMHDNGLSILPGDANPELTRGHPLLFYFTAALWSKIFGTSLISFHLFSLCISCLLIIAVYWFGKRLFNIHTAYISVIFLLCQSFFIAQSTLLLPEIFLALFTILSIHAYFKKKWIQFVIFSSAVVMTKETGLVLIIAFITDRLIISKLFFKEKYDKLFLKEMLFILLPISVFGSFLAIQRIRLGWFLFPEHLGYIKSDTNYILYCFKEFTKLLIYQNGRKLLFFLSMTFALYLTLRKKFDSEAIRPLIFICIFILGYLAFASMNFFTNRYILSILPLFLMMCSYILSKTFENKIFLGIASGLLFLFFSYKTIYKYWDEADTSLGFIETVKLHKEVVNYCEKEQFYNKSIYANFLLINDMQYPFLGYRDDKTKAFSRINSSKECNNEIFIFYSCESDPYRNEIATDTARYSLIRPFKRGIAWAEIYQKK